MMTVILDQQAILAQITALEEVQVLSLGSSGLSDFLLIDFCWKLSVCYMAFLYIMYILYFAILPFFSYVILWPFY